MTPHRLARSVLVVVVPLAMTVAGGEHSVISMPPVGTAAAAPSAAGPLRQPDVKPDVVTTYSRLRLQFETNLGQTDSTVKFLARGPGYTVFLTPREAVLVLNSPQPSDETRATVRRLDRRGPERRERKTAEPGATVVRLGLAESNPSPEVVGLEPLPGKVNYFKGNDPHKWRTGIPTYAKVRYRDVYPGVDVVYYGAQRQLEYDFVVAPGADPTRIRLAVKGAETLTVDGAGDLWLQTASGALRLHKPLIYQETGGVRREIAGGYVLLGKDRVSFHVAAYDAGRPLVIDPVLSYSTYLGGSGHDYGHGVAVDTAGNAYVIGTTYSVDFPSVNALRTTLGGSSDAFVAKLNAAGSALVYSTYLGGSNSDAGTSIAVDSAGNAYLIGTTDSPDFPTVNALQPSLRGSQNAFVAKLNAAGSALVYSTYLGGSNNDAGTSIAVDIVGNAYLTGTTDSLDFPTVNALQPSLRGSSDAFLAKLNAAGSALVYSTYLGGSNSDVGAGIAVDSAGGAYVIGTTHSPDFPTVNALQPSLRGSLPGSQNAFVAKLNAAGSTLVYSTYLGGSGGFFCDEFFFNCYSTVGDYGSGIAVDSSGNAYVTGATVSPDFPTVNALQPTLSHSSDAFVAKLNASGSALVYSTYLGGSDVLKCQFNDDVLFCYEDGDYGSGIAVDGAGNAYVTGSTYSPDFPTVNALQPTLSACCGSDAFVAKLNAAGSALVYSTYLGGSNSDGGTGIAVDSAGNAYLIGTTDSPDFPMVNALQPTGVRSAFVARISSTTTQPPVASFTFACSGLACSFDGSSSSDPDGTIISYSWDFGDGATGSGPIASHTYVAAGAYIVMLTVTDNAGATGTQSNSVTAGQTHVGDLDGTSVNQQQTWMATVTITVHDGSHQLVANATVSGSWSGGGGTGSCTTNGSGQCTVSKSKIPKRNASVTFGVVNVTHATLTYDSPDNHDPDGDSNGTVITLSRP